MEAEEVGGKGGSGERSCLQVKRGLCPAETEVRGASVTGELGGRKDIGGGKICDLSKKRKFFNRKLENSQPGANSVVES